MMNNEQIVEALKESGMRITRQRMIVADETFDAVTSNYVYYNIPSKDRQAILMGRK